METLPYAFVSEVLRDRIIDKLDKCVVSRDSQVIVRCGELHAKIGPSHLVERLSSQCLSYFMILLFISSPSNSKIAAIKLEGGVEDAVKLSTQFEGHIDWVPGHGLQYWIMFILAFAPLLLFLHPKSLSKVLGIGMPRVVHTTQTTFGRSDHTVL